MAGTPPFKTLREAYGFRIELMSNKLVERDKLIINELNSNSDGDFKSYARTGYHFFGETIYYHANTLNSKVDEFRKVQGEIVKSLYNEKTPIKELIDLDVDLETTLNYINTKAKIPSVASLLVDPGIMNNANIQGSKNNDEIKKIVDACMVSTALELLENNRKLLTKYEADYTAMYIQNERLEKKSKERDKNWDKIIKGIQDNKNLNEDVGKLKSKINYLKNMMKYADTKSDNGQPHVTVMNMIETGDPALEAPVREKLRQMLKNYSNKSSAERTTSAWYKFLDDVYYVCSGRVSELTAELVLTQMKIAEGEVQYPIITMLKTSKFKKGVDDKVVYDFIYKAIQTAKTAQVELKDKIMSQSFNLYKLNYVVAQAVNRLGIGPKNQSEFALKANKYIKKRMNEGFGVLTLINLALTIATIACFFIPGAGPLGIVLGFAGAAIGGATSYKEFNEAIASSQVFQSQVNKNSKLSSITQEQVDTQMFWAYFNMGLSALDIVMSTIQLAKLSVLSSRISKEAFADVVTLSGSKFNRILDLKEESIEVFAKRIRNLPKAERSKEIKKLLDSVEDINKYVDVSKMSEKEVMQLLEKYEKLSRRNIDEIAKALNARKGKAFTKEQIAVILKTETKPPKVLARVSLGSHTTLSGKELAWVCDPAEIQGLSNGEIMRRIGWTSDYIEEAERNKVTFKIMLVEDPGNLRVPTWDDMRNEVEQLLKSDLKFKKDFQKLGLNSNKIEIYINELKNVPIDKMKTLKGDLKIFRELLESKFGCNELFSGKGFTVTKDGNFGLREWILSKPNIGWELVDMEKAGFKVKDIRLKWE